VLAGRSARYALLALTAVAAIAALAATVGGGRATAASGAGLPSAQPMLGLPVENTILIGSSPAETAGETWGYALTAEGFQLVRYTPAEGWRIQPQPVSSKGELLTGFTPAPGPQAGRTTPAGGVAILGQDAAKVDQLLVRDPGQSLREASTPAVEPKQGEPAEPNAVLQPGEALLPSSGEGALLAAVDTEAGRTGVFVVPHESDAAPPGAVLFYDGSSWHREPICAESSGEPCTPPGPGFKVLGIDASSPHNAWLLVQTGKAEEGVALYTREAGEAGKAEPRWVQRPLSSPLAQASHSYEDPRTHSTLSTTITTSGIGQPITVSETGVWVDARLAIAGQPAPTFLTLFYSLAEHRVAQSWCSPPEALASLKSWKEDPLCGLKLESEAPRGQYRSFAWSDGGAYGKRVVTGLREGVTLDLQGELFQRMPGVGGENGGSAGAAFSSPLEGWLAPQEGLQLTRLSTSREPDLLQPWPVDFRRPLTAIAAQPGTVPGELGAQAITVGVLGEVAHYFPGQGWVPEALLSSIGQAEEAELRGVAWPEPGRAYAVGTHGAMWLWQQSTGLWEPDPARPPNLFLANFTGIAFNQNNPSQGFAVGQQGLLLAYGKTWEQQQLPTGLEGPEGANFTSVAFAGEEALATYQVPNFKNGNAGYVGGVLQYSEDPALCPPGVPTCWHADGEVDAALGAGSIPVRVAGLADGGAVIATAEGQLIERQQSGSPWLPTPAGRLTGFPVALAPFREGSTLRAVVSVDTSIEAGGLTQDLHDDEALRQTASSDQAPVVTAPYALPGSGYVLREGPTGWHDEEHLDYPARNHSESLPPQETGLDWPVLPDAVLALALPPDGGPGWAVGGQTGTVDSNGGSGAAGVEAIQTAGVMRYPAQGAAPIGFAKMPEQGRTGMATFAIGGNAQCASACADLSEDELGPDEWLVNARVQARQSGVRAFLYTGPHLAPGLGQAIGTGTFDEFAFQREEGSYAQLLGPAEDLPPGLSAPAEDGPLPPTFAAPAESDLDGSGTLETFEHFFEPTMFQPEGAVPAPAGVTAKSQASSGATYFSFNSAAPASGGPGETVRVIVLDYSRTSLGLPQQCWLAEQLAGARVEQVPAIVIGNRDLTGEDGQNAAADGSSVAQILVGDTQKILLEDPGCHVTLGVGAHDARTGRASAYFFDWPEQNRALTIKVGEEVLDAFGSGTLGYVNPLRGKESEFLGASGFLLSEVGQLNAKTDEAPVKARLIPDISQLAIHPTNGVLLRRSQAALFQGLGRRPIAGMECAVEAASCSFDPDPYAPIPNPCTGPACATGIFPEYTFTSSNRDIGQFVEVDPASLEATTVLQGAGGKPIPDEPRNGQSELTASGRFEENAAGQRLNERGEVVSSPASGLFCAYNSGTTTVTVRSGDLAYSQQVTILAGSVEQPCGTVRLLHPPAPTQQASLPVPLPALAPTPAPTPNATLPPPPTPPPAIPPTPHPVRIHPVPRSLPHVPPAAQLFPLIALVPPPAPSAARPTPPSGTAQVPAQSPVSQQVTVAEREREQESAVQHVHHMAAYRQPEEDPVPGWPLGLILIAVAAGVGTHRRRTGTLAWAEQSADGR
jgi:hypothetical protein